VLDEPTPPSPEINFRRSRRTANLAPWPQTRMRPNGEHKTFLRASVGTTATSGKSLHRSILFDTFVALDTWPASGLDASPYMTPATRIRTSPILRRGAGEGESPGDHQFARRRLGPGARSAVDPTAGSPSPAQSGRSQARKRRADLRSSNPGSSVRLEGCRLRRSLATEGPVPGPPTARELVGVHGEFGRTNGPGHSPCMRPVHCAGPGRPLVPPVPGRSLVRGKWHRRVPKRDGCGRPSALAPARSGVESGTPARSRVGRRRVRLEGLCGPDRWQPFEKLATLCDFGPKVGWHPDPREAVGQAFQPDAPGVSGLEAGRS
jgi:hypothetical protein